jgi:hypothetical protein
LVDVSACFCFGISHFCKLLIVVMGSIRNCHAGDIWSYFAVLFVGPFSFQEHAFQIIFVVVGFIPYAWALVGQDGTESDNSRGMWVLLNTN